MMPRCERDRGIGGTSEERREKEKEKVETEWWMVDGGWWMVDECGGWMTTVLDSSTSLCVPLYGRWTLDGTAKECSQVATLGEQIGRATTTRNALLARMKQETSSTRGTRDQI
jgi:hypothetical protein